MIPFPVRVDANTLPALVMGALLLLVAAALSLKQWWAYRRLTLNPKVDEAGYVHTERQIRNRLIVGGLMFVLGVAIPLGDQADVFFRARPGLFFAYWMVVLLLVFAMVVVVIGDVLSTLAYARVAQFALRRERRELEEEIRRYRASKNGHADSETQDANRHEP